MSRLGVFGDLIKYRLSLAVTFSAVTGYSISGSHTLKSLALLVPGVFLLASGAAALNQYSERAYDARMYRTMNRPIPGLKIDERKALIIALILLSTGSLSLLLNGPIPCILGIVTVILYNLVYTRLKKVSALAVIPGALVGALPPLIGFSSAGGFIPDKEIILFSSFMLLWQLPHFWLILIRYRNEYKMAGFKTLPETLSESQVRRLVFIWMVFSTLLLISLSISGLVFKFPLNLIVIPLNIIFILLFYIFLFRIEDRKSARDSFILINSFSVLMMIMFIMNSFIN